MAAAASITERFIKGSDNVITLKLLEGGVQISGAWTFLDIYIGNPVVLTISRTSNSAGVALTNGLLTIQPSQLSENVAPLIAEQVYPVFIKLRDATTHQAGAYFGAKDSINKLFFEISDPPG